jgi:hypothetical protein
VIVQSMYLPQGELLLTHASLTDQLSTNISRSCYVVTSASANELGLRDGLYSELVTPVHQINKVYVWHGIELRLLRRFGSNLVWSVVHSESPPSPAAEATCSG